MNKANAINSGPLNSPELQPHAATPTSPPQQDGNPDEKASGSPDLADNLRKAKQKRAKAFTPK
jgi:hypothetical protein